MSAIQILFSFIFSILLTTPSVFAATFETPVKEGDRLVLKGFEAQVQLTAQPNPVLKVTGVDETKAEGSYVIERKDNIIEIRIVEFNGKTSWKNILPKASAQMRKIEISGLPLPTEIQLRGGSVVAQRWTKDLKVSLTQGRVSLLNGAGSAQVYVQKGEVNIQDHTGRVTVDGYSGNCALRNITGDVDVSWFSGQLGMEKIRGSVNMSTQQATAKLNAGAGSVQFSNGKGSLVLQAFQGRMEGQNQDGNVTVLMPMDSEVDVKSKAGKVAVTVPAGSGAQVNLFTMDGEISVPGELRVVKLSSEKSVRGKLRGDAQRASVFVRSQEGSILLK